MNAGKPNSSEKTDMHALLRSMLLIRHFEEQAVEEYSSMKIRGFLHLYIGEEAVAAGVMAALTPEDAVISTYREHGHALARGISANRVMAELFGKREGCSGGRGGSMHIFDAESRFYGGHAIVGGALPAAVGLALADKMQGRSRATACFFGEGAVAEGVFHESMNLAALWELPVMFCCENNLYAMGTRLERSESQPNLYLKAQSYGMDASVVDGMDVLAVRDAARQAVRTVRNNEGPQFLELRTYRFRAHSMFDPELYRDKSEVEEWKKRDPIALFVEQLRDQNLLNDSDYKALRAGVAQEIREAVEFAEAGHWEPVETLMNDVHGERVGVL